MDDDRKARIRAATDRVLELAEEVEAHGHAMEDDALETGRAALHAWIDTMTGVAVTPAFGRVTLIHENGSQSTISSSDLAYAMSRPAAG
jgi:hypothetical protein